MRRGIVNDIVTYQFNYISSHISLDYLFVTVTAY